MYVKGIHTSAYIYSHRHMSSMCTRSSCIKNRKIDHPNIVVHHIYYVIDWAMLISIREEWGPNPIQHPSYFPCTFYHLCYIRLRVVVYLVSNANQILYTELVGSATPYLLCSQLWHTWIG